MNGVGIQTEDLQDEWLERFEPSLPFSAVACDFQSFLRRPARLVFSEAFAASGDARAGLLKNKGTSSGRAESAR
jgi:hypothetical protein